MGPSYYLLTTSPHDIIYKYLEERVCDRFRGDYMTTVNLNNSHMNVLFQSELSISTCGRFRRYTEPCSGYSINKILKNTSHGY